MLKAADGSSSSVLYVGMHTIVRAPFVDELHQSVIDICALMRAKHGETLKGQEAGYTVPEKDDSQKFSDPELGEVTRIVTTCYGYGPATFGTSEQYLVSITLAHRLKEAAVSIRAMLGFNFSLLNKKGVLHCELIRTQGNDTSTQHITDDLSVVDSASLAHALVLTGRNLLVCKPHTLPGDFDPSILIDDLQARVQRVPLNLETLSLDHLPVDTAAGMPGSDKAFHAHLLRSVGYSVQR